MLHSPDFNIIVTNSTVTRDLPVLPNNIIVIVVPPGREEDDAICLCLAAQYIKSSTNDGRLFIYTEDDYTRAQHYYDYTLETRVNLNSLTYIYNAIINDDSLRITDYDVRAICRPLIAHPTRSVVATPDIMARRQARFFGAPAGDSALGGGFYHKYLKYKNKYLNLKNLKKLDLN